MRAGLPGPGNGILTVGIVTKPFHFEGSQRMKMRKRIEECVIADTDHHPKLYPSCNEKTTSRKPLRWPTMCYSGVRGVTDLINLDFSYAPSHEMGKQDGHRWADGESRAIAAAEAAISNPLLDDITMRGARLIIITGGLTWSRPTAVTDREERGQYSLVDVPMAMEGRCVSAV